mmetsp:Transcript_48593/g.80710  ORF Transcript_48593/g.80710 Transcript_48593/m.80710 type:complete len:404 (-) Transcript_48593:590-1801(-)
MLSHMQYGADESNDPHDNNGFIGNDLGGSSQGAGEFFLAGYKDHEGNGSKYAFWWFQFVFAAAASTIVSGAMAERTALPGYLIYTTVITGLIYPVVAHWVWSSYGWASAFNTQQNYLKPFRGGCVDFAGSGVVHMTGGVAALVGAICVGPRIGRFDSEKKVCPMPGHSTTLQVLGTFILWFGWYGFNPGSTLGISAPNYARDAARSVVTTTLSAAAGGITVVLLAFALTKTWEVGAVCNGILAGLVSITAGCSVVLPWHAFLIGITGGCVYFGTSNLILKILKIDDPLDAFAVHGACGFWGVIMAACFAFPDYTYSGYINGSHSRKGLFFNDGMLLEAALVTLIAEIAWVGGMSCILFIPMKFAGILRVSAEVEEAGMDVSKHGGSAYEIQGASTGGGQQSTA